MSFLFIVSHVSGMGSLKDFAFDRGRSEAAVDSAPKDLSDEEVSYTAQRHLALLMASKHVVYMFTVLMNSI